jgi:hypothetical protein
MESASQPEVVEISDESREAKPVNTDDIPQTDITAQVEEVCSPFEEVVKLFPIQYRPGLLTIKAMQDCFNQERPVREPSGLRSKDIYFSPVCLKIWPPQDEREAKYHHFSNKLVKECAGHAIDFTIRLHHVERLRLLDHFVLSGASNWYLSRGVDFLFFLAFQQPHRLDALTHLEHCDQEQVRLLIEAYRAMLKDVGRDGFIYEDELGHYRLLHLDGDFSQINESSSCYECTLTRRNLSVRDVLERRPMGTLGIAHAGFVEASLQRVLYERPELVTQASSSSSLDEESLEDSSQD